MSLWERARSWPAWVWPAALVAVCFAVHLPAALNPLFHDDAFEIRRALDPSWQNWLFAYSYKAPNADVPWWFGQFYDRRVVRIVPSAILSAEVRLVGYNALVLHLTNLTIVAATAVLVQRLLTRWTNDAPAAALATLAVAVHPAASEMTMLACDLPLAVAALAGVIAVSFWDRMRHNGSRKALAGSLVAGFIALTSYEGALLLPLGIAAADAWILRKRSDPPGGVWTPRLAMLGLIVLYVPIVVWAQHGVTHPDHEALRSLDTVFNALRIDTEAYVAKTFLLVDPREPWSYWFHNAVGEAIAVAILAVPIVALVVGTADRRLCWLGLAAFAAFLAPPLVTRAAIALMNTPTLRQIYLPFVFGMAPILTAVLVRPKYRGWWFAAVAVFAVASAIQSIRIATEIRVLQMTDRLTEAVRAAVADQDPRKTLVVVGDNRCAFSPKFVWPGDVVRAFPSPKRADDEVVLTVIDEHTIEARAASGFDRVPLDQPLPLQAPPGRYNQGPNRVVRQAAFTRERTTLAIHGATIDLVERTENAPTVLRARLERPLSESVVLLTRGCEAARVIHVTPKS